MTSVPLDSAAVQSPKRDGLLRRLGFAAYVLAILAALFVGWRLSRFDYLTPENGIGYALGITGGSAMLLLLLYPLRKRFRALALIGSVRGWFRLHMVLGILGPVLILFHCNFNLGSTNSNVALTCMLIVSSSGLIGRYTYAKFHKGLYGEVQSFTALHQDFSKKLKALSEFIGEEASGRTALGLDTEGRPIRPRSLIAAVRFSRARSKDVQNIKRFARRALKAPAIKNDKALKARIRQTTKAYAVASDRLADAVLYERLFALWHFAHLPLFFMLVIAAIVHVIAVHAY